MGLFKRISDIVAANLGELADEFEDPELMLKQATREMEEMIGDVTNQTAKAMANEKTLKRELQRNRQQVEQWEGRAAAAVEADDDEMAKKALARKNEYRKIVDALEDQLESATDAARSLRRQLEGMKSKLAEAKRSLATLSARKRSADFRKKMAASAAGIPLNVDDDVFTKFDRLRNKVEQAEAEAEAMTELRDSFPSTETFATVESGDETLDIKAELAELKKRRKN